jgi:transposase
MSPCSPEAAKPAVARDASLPPFAQQFVTLTKQEHIELVCQARAWKSLHDRAVKRELKLLEKLRDQTELADRREAALRAELEVERARVRDLKQRLSLSSP